ncbi:putative quinol monooxygenase [Dyadobacter pollutisoli]|uniref:Antibiotic biosynthesis monooxygenase n=1 Tax=Dyadobacter pollutisoli TaxID=2910158 RepID=A0A9E8N9I5_9BACT|nr:antibiotic biosynthesis monooxygenase [Dyadobacter pollutisoli]WAC12469.1 antibiotic biosynthesis monooxygenase [Dyadobacter pollutisoli]
MKATTQLSVSRKRTVTSIAVLLLLLNANLNAQNKNMVARLTRYEVKPEHQNGFRKAISEYVLRSLDLGSNIMAEAYFEEANPTVWWIIERWSSKKEFEKNSASSGFKATELLFAKALVQPAKVIYVKDLEPLSKQQWRKTARKNDKPITIMLFVDAKAGTEGNFKKVYHTAMPQFRGEPGVVTYQLSQLEEDSTRFVTYEKFRGEDAFQYHLKFPPIQPVIDYLETSIRQQPFQTGIHRLIEFAPLTRE